METTKKSRRKATGTAANRISTAYIDFLLSEGKRPSSVYKFCMDLGVAETDFYQHFGSFDGIEDSVWKEFIDKTIGRLRSDKSFAGFSCREKVLSFYYALFEELKNHRSFALNQLKIFRRPSLVPGYLEGFKASFDTFFQAVINEGIANGEVAKRPYLDKKYPQLFWFHLGFLLLFWKEDDSAGFERTDAAVEKSVNLAFDLIGKGAVDSAIDFAKFLYQVKI